MKAINAITMLFLLASAMFFTTSCDQNPYVNIQGYAQGGTYMVTAGVKNAKVKPEEMKRKIDSLLNVIDFSVSGYNKESILSKFNGGESVVPDEVFVDLYNRSHELWQESDGVLDVASAPLFDLWGFGFTNDTLPAPELVSATLESCGMDRLIPEMGAAVGEDGQLLPSALFKEGAPHREVLPKLNYNAVAQGYSVDVISEYLYSVGVNDMLINVGGEIFCDGLNPGGKNWSLGIDKPIDGNNVSGEILQGIFHAPDCPCGIVTSGNYRKFYVKDGKKYSHSIDPRTGYPVSHSLLSATIITTDPDSTANSSFLSTKADALATISMVLGVEKAAEMVESMPDVEACLIYDADGTMEAWTSSGFTLE